MAIPALSVRDVSKWYGERSFLTWLGGRQHASVRALDAVGFDLEPAEVTALLGPNGSGKTTLMNIIADLVRADSGTVSVCGLPVPDRSREAQRHLGLVPANERSFFWRLTGRQNLEFFADLHGLERSESRPKIRRLLETFGLAAAADRRFLTYSAGMKKRLSIARAMLHGPRVLLMDEPTNGLDAQGMDDLVEFVRSDLTRLGCTILWATHRLEEVRRLCDRVIVLGAGRVRFQGTTKEFENRVARDVRYLLECEVPEIARPAVDAITRSAGAAETEYRGDLLKLRLAARDGEDPLTGVLRDLAAAGATIRLVEREAESLQGIFVRLGVTAAASSMGGSDAS
jgi:ABC-2 type transport system ATP-binding protein